MQPSGPPPPPAPPNGGYGAPPPGYSQAPQPPHTSQPSPYGAPPPYPYSPYGAGHPGYPPPPPAFAPNEPKAGTALALGISSLVCFGLLTGIPAIFVGIASRRRIAQSNGALQGDSMALGGIITGAIGSFFSVMMFGFVMLGVLGGVMGAMNETRPSSSVPPSVAAPSEDDDSQDDSVTGDVESADGTERAHAKAPSPPAAPVTIVDLTPARGPLKAQLASESKSAAKAKQTLLVQTTAPKCGACQEIATAMRDNEVAAALMNVRVVRVDIEAFKADLKPAGLSRDGLPWFFLLDSALTPHDSISADEWDANVAENIAPVLGEFVQGKLKERRSAAPTEL